MYRIAYIHGFNSGPNGRSGRLLSVVTGQAVVCLSYDYSQPFEGCLSALKKQLNFYFGASDRICLMGSSLGGFYALQLRHAAISHVIAWNPGVNPAVQLEQFLGSNTRFTDGKRWIFTESICHSYALAPDARRWNESEVGAETPRRDIYVGNQDEILDSGLTLAYWRGFANLHVIQSGHQIEDYAPMREVILSGLKQDDDAAS